MNTYNIRRLDTKNTLVILSLLFNLFFVYSVYTRSACVIVHGTWASGASWYRSGGDFFEAVAQTACKFSIVDCIVSFTWSGDLGSMPQWQAACELIEMMAQYDEVILIAHSHGATVGILASRMIGKKITGKKFTTKIKKFYALGVPVDPTGVNYPDMSVIEGFYNLFSFGDIIQPVQGLYHRVFELSHPAAVNICVRYKDCHPSHSQLHGPIIGNHLLCIPEVYAAMKFANFDTFTYSVPGQIFFDTKLLPYYCVQPNQFDLIASDKIATQLMREAFMKKIPQDEV